MSGFELHRIEQSEAAYEQYRRNMENLDASNREFHQRMNKWNDRVNCCLCGMSIVTGAVILASFIILVL